MRLEPPVEVTRDKITFDVSEIEPILQGPAMDIPPFPSAMVTLKDGSTMVIRQAKLEEAPVMLEYVEKVMKIPHDFHDIVGGSRSMPKILGLGPQAGWKGPPNTDHSGLHPNRGNGSGLSPKGRLEETRRST